MIKALPGDELVDGFETPRVCAISGVPPSTLDYWVQSGLVAPSHHASSGRRATRVWSLEDLVLVRSIRALREAGCPMQALRQAKDLIENSWGEQIAHLVLCWSGGDLLVVERWGTVRSAMKYPGQAVLHLVAIPMQEWRAEATEKMQEAINITARQRSAEARGKRPRTPVADIGM